MRRFLLILFAVLFTAVFAQGQSRATGTTGATPNPVLRYFPNPSTTFVTFEFLKSFETGYSLQVYSFLGKKVYESKNMQQRTTINLNANDYNRGVYVYQLRDRTGRMIESGKFQVSR